MYPKFSVIDPETTFSLPPRQVGNGIVDAFVHVLEQYLTYPGECAPFQDRFAEAILLTLIEEGRRKPGGSGRLRRAREFVLVRHHGAERADRRSGCRRTGAPT